MWLWKFWLWAVVESWTMPKDEWAAAKRKDIARKRGRRNPWLKKRNRTHAHRWRKDKPAKQTQPEQYVRPAFDDFPPVAVRSVTRQYDPALYSFPAGTLWPATVADAQAGRHRQPDEQQRLRDAFPDLEMNQ